MLRVAPAAVLVTGCAQLFGIDTTSGAGDAGATAAHITFTRASIGAQAVLSPLDLTGLSATFLIPDATAPSGYRSIPGVSNGSGEWTADVPSGDPLVDFTWPSVAGSGPTRHLWAFPARDVEATYDIFEDPDPQPPPASATLDLSVSIPAFMSATEQYEIQAIGPWADHVLAGGELPAANATMLVTSLAYSTFTSLAVPPISTITSSDRVVVERHTGTALTGVLETSFDEIAGSNAITGTLMDVPQSQTFDAAIDPPGLVPRFSAVRPVVANLSMSWLVDATPGYTQLELDGPQLVAGTVLPADTTITSAYANPFEADGWHAILTFSIYETRVVTLTSGDMISLYAGLTSHVEPAAGLTLDLPAGLPQTVSLNQISLTSDNMTVTLDPTAYATVTMVADQAANTMYEVMVHEVLAGTPATLSTVVDLLTSDPTKLIIPPGVFVAGHRYMIEAITYQGGFPNAAAGDLVNRSFPSHSAYNDSGVFTVVTP